ncbi:hypothetical protein ACEQLT_004486 [Salmonella enterica]
MDEIKVLTYAGKVCRVCHGRERYISDDRCVACKARVNKGVYRRRVERLQAGI